MNQKYLAIGQAHDRHPSHGVTVDCYYILIQAPYSPNKTTDPGTRTQDIPAFPPSIRLPSCLWAGPGLMASNHEMTQTKPPRSIATQNSPIQKQIQKPEKNMESDPRKRTAGFSLWARQVRDSFLQYAESETAYMDRQV